MTCENCFLHQKIKECQEFCDTRRTIPVEDKKGSNKKWTFSNPKNKCVCLIKIDGCVITDSISNSKRCDHLFLVCDETEKSAFFVELKGSDLGGALKQFSKTIPFLQEYLTGFCLYARIALSKVRTQEFGNSNTKKTKEKIESLLQQKGCNSRKPLVYSNSSTSETI